MVVEQGSEDENEDEDGKEQDDKEQEASPGFPDSPTIPAAYPGELAAEGSDEASIADPCNAESDATLGITNGGGGFQEVRPRNRRSTGQPRKRTNKESRQPGRVVEVLRQPPATIAAPTTSSQTRVLTLRRGTRSSHWMIA